MAFRRAALLLLPLLACCVRPVPADPDAGWRGPAVSATAWNALFTRTSGWTGGDGIFSVALDGDDALASAGAGSRTLWWFSDSMIGTVDAGGGHARGSRMVNNCVAALFGARPSAAHLRFQWARDEKGAARTVFLPRTPATRAGEWYWLGDGFVDGGEVVIFGIRMARRGTGGVFDFVQRGHALLRVRVDSEGNAAEQEQIDLPLWLPGDGERTELALGSGVLLHDSKSGAARPDGYVYVYGTWNRGFDKELVAARVRPGAARDAAAWRFWDGAGWSSELADLAPICGRVSSELSVTPLRDGRYVLTFLDGGMGKWVAVRVGSSPVGPFGEVRRIWRCPEVGMHPGVFAYNAKAHPHLSSAGELLISYNVNTTDFRGEFLKDAAIYRPRFVRLPLAWLAGE